MTDNEEDFCDYALSLERIWKQELEKSLPRSEKEWLGVFPEAINIIPEKIKEWEEVLSKSRVEINKKKQEVKRDYRAEDYWFGEEIMKYTFEPVKDFALANWNIKRLKYLLPIISLKQNNKKIKWEHLLEQARKKNIFDVAQTYNLRLQKNGKSYKTLCPLHNEKSPSFNIYPPTHFVCFGCGIKGDVIKLVEMMDRLNFRDAVYKLQNL